jgi:hypothetical protein
MDIGHMLVPSSIHRMDSMEISQNIGYNKNSSTNGFFNSILAM